MKYNITYACGHEGVVNLGGPEKDRERTIHYLEHSGECPTCKAERLQNERAAASEEAEKQDLPDLLGSDKQVVWAAQIRRHFCDYSRQMIDRAAENISCLPEDEQPKARAGVQDLYAARNHILTSYSHSKWWIEHQSERDFYMAIYNTTLAIREATVTKPMRDNIAQKTNEAEAEAVVVPINQTHSGVVKIIVDGNTISVRYPRDDDFRSVVYTRGVVPDETMLITGGVDKQKTCFYYTVRGWGANRKSWNIDHGSAKTYKEVLEIFDQGYHDEAGGLHYVDLALMDSGDDTDEVYDFCYVNQGLFAPVKGSSTMLPSRFRLSVIDKANSAANGMRLIICDGSYYKDMIFRRLNRPEDNSWSVYDGCDQEYAEQIVSEHKVLDRVGGRPVWVWRPKMSGIDNHYLDCEVYAACAADVMGGFELLEADREDEEPPKQLPPAQDNSESGWLPGGGWLPEGNWL